MASFPTSMTVSVSKGTKGEGSLAHTHRKEVLKKMSKEKQEAFLQKKGHTHIKPEYIDLNVDRDYTQNLLDLFNSKAMEQSLLEYNKGKRKNRQIGKGEALTCEEKKRQLKAIENVQAYLRLPKKDQQEFLSTLSKEDRSACFSVYKKYSSLRDLQKVHTKLERTDTLGEAYYKKLLKQKGKKGKIYSEFVIQIGNAADYNEIDSNGKILESYDRRDPEGVWQQAKKVYIDYISNFSKRNKKLFPMGFSIHMDEKGSPHMHLDIVGIGLREKVQARGKTRKNGPGIRIGFNAALESQGFKVDHESPQEAFSAWQAQEQEALADSMKRVLGVERKLGKTNELENIHQYKEYKKQEVEERARLKKVTKQVEEQENKKAELESSVKDLEDQKQSLNQELATGIEKVKEAQEWTEKKSLELDHREKAVISKELAFSHREDELTTRENILKQSENSLKSKKMAFTKKVEEEGNLDERLVSLRTTVKSYSDGLTKKKEAIKAKKKRELAEELTKYHDEKLVEIHKQVDRDRQAYIDNVNRKYRQSLEQREKDLEQREEDQDQRENRFVTKVKTFVTGFQTAYISAGLKSMYGTKREVQYHVQKYLQMDRDQQKAVEKQAFSGPAGLYVKLEAFKEAVDYLFHGAPDAAELSPLKSLEGLAGEAEAEARRYNNLQNSRGRGSASPARSIDHEL